MAAYAYDIRSLGDYAKDFDLVREAIRGSVLEFTGNQISRVEIKENEDGKVEYDQDQFVSALQNIHLVRERSDILTALFYDGFKLLNEEVKNAKLSDEGTDEQ